MRLPLRILSALRLFLAARVQKLNSPSLRSLVNCMATARSNVDPRLLAARRTIAAQNQAHIFHHRFATGLGGKKDPRKCSALRETAGPELGACVLAEARCAGS